MNAYPVELTPDDNDTVMVTFPDVPEAVSFGDDKADALARAADALETALNGYIADRRDIPEPSAADGRKVVCLSLLATLKLGIYSRMRASGWRKADLARAMAVNPRQIDRLLDLTHASTVQQLEQATMLAGGQYVVEVREVVGVGPRPVYWSSIERPSVPRDKSALVRGIAGQVALTVGALTDAPKARCDALPKRDRAKG